MSDASVLSLAAVAGEKSGDLLGASVLAALGARCAGLRCAGVGGPAMAGAGLERWWDIESLSVSGYADVLREYPRLHRMREQLIGRIQGWHPACFLGIDAPDFNLAIEARLRAAGVPVVHFISPSIWAWRRRRIGRIRAAVDHMLLIFPHELEIYQAAGIPATYVGHPMADTIPLIPDPARARATLGLGVATQIALLPGSRVAELRHMARRFIETAAWIHARRSDIEFVLPVASPAHYGPMIAAVREARLPERMVLRVISGRSQEALEAADAVLVASGTATLEAALFKKPMVIAYRMAWASYQIMRRMAYLPHVGLPNILCGQEIVPEFLQDAVVPDTMGAALLAQLEGDAARDVLVERFSALHESLRRGCAQRAADRVLEFARA